MNSSAFLSSRFGDKLESWMVRHPCIYVCVHVLCTTATYVYNNSTMCVPYVVFLALCSPNLETPEIGPTQPRRMAAMVRVTVCFLASMRCMGRVTYMYILGDNSLDRP